MNDRGDGSESKNFLSRWSQRKQEARQPERDRPPEARPPEQPAQKPAEPEFDLSSLPKLEELTETTDITAFLRKGVPEQLRNAALRKSWALDPAIRNYVNPALDYAYDWNTPGGVPGSGEIGPGVDVARMVAQIMGTSEPVADQAAAASPSASAAVPPPQEIVAQPVQPELAVQPVRVAEQARSGAEDSASGVAEELAKTEPSPAAPQQTVRRHGTAKPLI
jgi:Protein of unknown function (DUF3306)